MHVSVMNWCTHTLGMRDEVSGSSLVMCQYSILLGVGRYGIHLLAWLLAIIHTMHNIDAAVDDNSSDEDEAAAVTVCLHSKCRMLVDSEWILISCVRSILANSQFFTSRHMQPYLYGLVLFVRQHNFTDRRMCF